VAYAEHQPMSVMHSATEAACVACSST